MSVKIIVDSTADLIPALKENLTVVPLSLRFGDEEFIDGVTIDHQRFYEKLVETDIMPTTSQATPGDFEPVFEALRQKGDSAVVLTLSQTLSGTYQSACIAAADFDNIFVVDSATAAIGTGILAELAFSLVQAGHTAKEIAQILEEEKKRIRVIAMVDTLEYLKKGGRISATAAIAGGLLNIKPVLAIEEGEIKMLGKARGSKQAGNLLVQQIEKAGGIDFDRPILLGYTGLSDRLLLKYIEDSRALWENCTQSLRYTCIGSVIGTHAGPGAVAVAFFQQR